MSIRGLREIKTRKNILTLSGIICLLCLDIGVNPKTRLRCRLCYDTCYVRPSELSL